MFQLKKGKKLNINVPSNHKTNNCLPKASNPIQIKWISEKAEMQTQHSYHSMKTDL